MSSTNLIITGKTAQAHISSADDGSLHACIFGDGDYVLNRGDKFAASLSNSTVTIASGDLIMQGRYARITNQDQTVVTAPDNGTARYTDICFQYYKDTANNSVESIKVVAINGTATSEAGATPAAPVLTKGNIFNGDTTREVRICRVLYDTRGGTTSITLITEGMNELTLKETPYQAKTDVDAAIAGMQGSISAIQTTIAGHRNIILSTSEPTAAQGSDGDVWIVYTA